MQGEINQPCVPKVRRPQFSTKRGLCFSGALTKGFYLLTPKRAARAPTWKYCCSYTFLINAEKVLWRAVLYKYSTKKAALKLCNDILYTVHKLNETKLQVA